MSIAFVGQATPASTASAQTLAVSYTPSATGNLLVYAVAIHTGTTITVSSVKDNLNNTWTQVPTVGVQSGSNTRMDMWYLPNCPSGITSVTATFSSATTEAVASVTEWSGVKTTSPLDAENGGGGASAATQTTPATVASGSADLVIGCISTNTTPTITLNQGISSPSSGWNSLTGGVVGSGSTGHQLQYAYQIMSSSGTFDVGFSLSPNAPGGMVTAAFLAASGGGGATGTGVQVGVVTAATTAA